MPKSEFERFDTSPANWAGPQLSSAPQRWVHELTREELVELDNLATSRDDSRRSLIELKSAQLPLPILGKRLSAIRNELLDGVGIALVRGFAVKDYSIDQAALVFWAIGLQLGEPVSQNAAGHALGHVRDLGFDYSQPSSRGYQTAERLPYHCDSGDVVGLLCVQPARSGGLSSAVSSTRLYHAMVDRHPKAAAVLMEPTYRDRRGEIPTDAGPWYSMPVFNVYEGRVYGQYVRSSIRKAQRFEEVPRITQEQAEAFDLLDEMAASPEFRLDMEFQPGDMQFLCNHWIFHSRTRYEDWPEPNQRRHLLRLWLGCPDGPPVPPPHVLQQGLTNAGRPAGIHCGDIALNTPLEALDGGAGDSAQRQRD
jgi:hypothetical protein